MMISWKCLATERILLMCWHNCQALSQSDHLSTDPDMNMLQSSQFTEEMSASLADIPKPVVDLLLVDDGDDDKIMIFATEKNLWLMSEADAFYSAPKQER